MKQYKVLNTKDFVSDILKEEDIVFFVGSGISMWHPSNLPTGYELKRNLFKGITSCKALNSYFEGIYNDDTNKIKLPHEQWQKVPLEGMFGAVHTEIGNKLFNSLTFFNTNKYNFFHNLLVLLANETNHKTIITTNFDLLFEASFNKIKAFFNSLDGYPSSNEVNLIKLHGSYNDKNSIIMTLEREGVGLPKFFQDFLQKFLSGKVVCFVGYSASEFDIVPILYNIPFLKVYWIEKDENTIQNNLRMTKILEKNNSCVGFDMCQIFQEIHSRKPYYSISSSISWSHTDNSMSTVDFLKNELNNFQKFLITARIFRSILKTNFALEILLKCEKLLKSGKFIVGSDASNILNFELAETYKEKGNYFKANKYYLEYEKNLRKMQSTTSKVKILKAKREIAKIHVLRHEFDIAENELQKLIVDIENEIKMGNSDIFQLKSILADCKKNNSMVLLAKIQKGIISKQKIQKIEKFLKELYEIGINEGNIDKQAESKRFLARCRRIEKKYQEAYKLLEEVLEYFHFVGRTMGEINTLREYANNLIMEKRFHEAIEIHKKILKINKEFDEDYPTKIKSLWILTHLNLLSYRIFEGIKYFLKSISLSLYYWVSRKLTFSMIKDIAIPKANF